MHYVKRVQWYIDFEFNCVLDYRVMMLMMMMDPYTDSLENRIAEPIVALRKYAMEPKAYPWIDSLAVVVDCKCRYQHRAFVSGIHAPAVRSNCPYTHAVPWQ